MIGLTSYVPVNDGSNFHGQVRPVLVYQCHIKKYYFYGFLDPFRGQVSRKDFVSII